MSAFRFDDKREPFVSQLPLHEGRRNRVNRSGRIDLLACAERDAMRRAVNRHRIGPRDRALLVPEDERHMLFQFVQDDVDPLDRKT